MGNLRNLPKCKLTSILMKPRRKRSTLARKEPEKRRRLYHHERNESKKRKLLPPKNCLLKRRKRRNYPRSRSLPVHVEPEKLKQQRLLFVPDVARQLKQHLLLLFKKMMKQRMKFSSL